MMKYDVKPVSSYKIAGEPPGKRVYWPTTMKTILLTFRKRRPAANFRIEASSAEMTAVLDGQGRVEAKELVSSRVSSGILSRCAALLEVARKRADVFHVTDDVHFLTLALPGKRCMVTIHDVASLSRGRGALTRWLLKKLWKDWPVRHREVATTVSEATRLEVRRLTRCAPEKVLITPNVMWSSFKFSPKPFDSQCPTVLHIGLAPNKNFFRHVEALAGLRCELMVLGKLNDAHRSPLTKHAIEYLARENLTDPEMQAVYEGCDIVLFASTLEGFGMPIIERNTVGRAMVTSNISSMPEVAGNAACLVDPLNVASIRGGLERVIQDKHYREAPIEAGRSNCHRFSWHAFAEQYRETYACLAGLSKP